MRALTWKSRCPSHDARTGVVCLTDSSPPVVFVAWSWQWILWQFHHGGAVRFPDVTPFGALHSASKRKESWCVAALSSLQRTGSVLLQVLSSHVDAMLVLVCQRVLEATLPVRAHLQEQRARHWASIWKLLEQEEDANDKFVDRQGSPDHSRSASWKRRCAGLSGARGAVRGKDNRVLTVPDHGQIVESSEVQTDQRTEFYDCWEATAVEDGSGMCTASSTGNDVLRATLPRIFDRPKRSDIMDGTHQEVHAAHEGNDRVLTDTDRGNVVDSTRQEEVQNMLQEHIQNRTAEQTVAMSDSDNRDKSYWGKIRWRQSWNEKEARELVRWWKTEKEARKMWKWRMIGVRSGVLRCRSGAAETFGTIDWRGKGGHPGGGRWWVDAVDARREQAKFEVSEGWGRRTRVQVGWGERDLSKMTSLLLFTLRLEKQWKERWREQQKRGGDDGHQTNLEDERDDVLGRHCGTYYGADSQKGWVRNSSPPSMRLSRKNFSCHSFGSPAVWYMDGDRQWPSDWRVSQKFFCWFSHCAAPVSMVIPEHVELERPRPRRSDWLKSGLLEAPLDARPPSALQGYSSPQKSRAGQRGRPVRRQLGRPPTDQNSIRALRARLESPSALYPLEVERQRTPWATAYREVDSPSRWTRGTSKAAAASSPAKKSRTETASPAHRAICPASGSVQPLASRINTRRRFREGNPRKEHTGKRVDSGEPARRGPLSGRLQWGSSGYTSSSGATPTHTSSPCGHRTSPECANLYVLNAITLHLGGPPLRRLHLKKQCMSWASNGAPSSLWFQQ